MLTVMEDFRIKVFKAVYASGSFTKAAGMLGISQPAVSQNISELEKELGIQLFTRSGGKVETTRQGEIFMRYADRISSAYDSVSAAFMTPISRSGFQCDGYGRGCRYLYRIGTLASERQSRFPLQRPSVGPSALLYCLFSPGESSCMIPDSICFSYCRASGRESHRIHSWHS